MTTDAELDYLEKLFGDAYRKEIVKRNGGVVRSGRSRTDEATQAPTGPPVRPARPDAASSTRGALLHG